MASSSKNINISSEESIVVTNFNKAPEATFSIEQGSVKACNHVALLDISDEISYFRDGALFLKKSPLSYVFTHIPLGITAHLQQFWYMDHCTTITTKKGNKLSAIEFTIRIGTIAITAGAVRAALHLLAREKNQDWDGEPSKEELQAFLEDIGYIWPASEKNEAKLNRDLTKIEKKRLPAKWQYIFTHVIQCLGTKTGAQEQAGKQFHDLAYSLCTSHKLNYATYIFD